MNRGEITELHYIAPIANVPSIMDHGILSHKLSAKIVHHSVAMPEIQQRRKNKRIPGAGFLHDYANLYFDAHNPMLSKCREHNGRICVLRIDPAVLDLPGVIVADRNAASDWVRFMSMAEALRIMDWNRVFAKYWTYSGDLHEEWTHKSQKCAEVLVPDSVKPDVLVGAYVVNEVALAMFRELRIDLSVSIRSDIFF